MNNEPVAWIKQDTLTYLGNYNYASITIQVQKSNSVGFDIPLYTQPVKEQELLGEIAHLKAELDTANKAYMWMDETYKGVLAELELLKSHPVKEQEGCGNCHACLVGVTEHGLPVTFQRMILCPDCGNKRCPKASNHRHQCTESNEPNQRGSIYAHPVKELTDKEIIKTMVQFDVYSSDDHCLIEAGRAILRKAQENETT